MRKIRTATIGLTFLGLTIAGTPEAPTANQRTGWHGEMMPDGLSRAAEKGEYLWKKDGSVMVYIPPGPFSMGSEEGHSDERPVHQVYLDGYYIDKYEVSFGQWKNSQLPLPKAPDWGRLDDHPVVNVSWNDVQPYLEWSGKRLPSEAEWEKAARGTDGRIFPWGDRPPRRPPRRLKEGETPPDLQLVIWKHHPQARVSTAPAGCCPEGASPYGAFNMAGNVYEWCQDWYDPQFYPTGSKRNPVNLKKARMRVLRGGAFIHEEPYMRTAYRYRLLPIDRTPYIGFRTAVPSPSAQQGSER